MWRSIALHACYSGAIGSFNPSVVVVTEKKTTDFNKEIYDVGCQSNLESIKRIGVIPRRYGRHRGRQATYFSLAKPLEEHQKAGRDRNLPQIMPHHAFHKYYPRPVRSQSCFQHITLPCMLAHALSASCNQFFAPSRAGCICSIVERSHLHTMIFIILSPEAEFRSHATTSSATENWSEHHLVLTVTFYRHWSSC